MAGKTGRNKRPPRHVARVQRDVMRAPAPRDRRTESAKNGARAEGAPEEKPAAGRRGPQEIPSVWSQRSLATLALLMLVLQIAVGGVTSAFSKQQFTPNNTKLTCQVPFLTTVLGPNPILFLLTAFLGSRLVPRLTGERRPMRALEALSFGAITSFLSYFATALFSKLLSPPQPTTCSIDGRWPTSFGLGLVTALAGTVLLFPTAYRLFWIPRRRIEQS